LVDGERTVSTLLEPDAWVTLRADVRAKRRAITMTPCGVPGIAKTSPRGTQFFAHKSGHSDCGSAHPGESALHLAAKAEILLGCADAGWDVLPEVRADDGSWIADVLAVRGGWKVAFEVQVSQQTHDRYVERQARYRRDGVRCAWYVKHAASVLAPDAELPTFLLEEDEHKALFVHVAEHRLSLREAAQGRLNGTIKFRQYVSNGELGHLKVELAASDACWRCDTSYLLWRVTEQRVLGRCGRIASQDLAAGSQMWGDSKPEADPAVRKVVSDAAEAHPLPLAKLSMKYTKTTNSRYMAFSCPRCGGVYGDWFLSGFWMNAHYDSDITTLTLPGRARGLKDPHWCVDQGGGVCDVSVSWTDGSSLSSTTGPG
jgi:hypothetical protein